MFLILSLTVCFPIVNCGEYALKIDIMFDQLGQGFSKTFRDTSIASPYLTIKTIIEIFLVTKKGRE